MTRIDLEPSPCVQERQSKVGNFIRSTPVLNYVHTLFSIFILFVLLENSADLVSDSEALSAERKHIRVFPHHNDGS